jgi:hypothetical protein
VREILIKEQQQRSVQTKPGRAEQSMSDKTWQFHQNCILIHSKTTTTSESSIDE